MTDVEVLKLQILRRLDEFRDAMAADGGGVELISITNDVVRLRLMGACRVCPSQILTLNQTVLPVVRDIVPSHYIIEVDR